MGPKNGLYIWAPYMGHGSHARQRIRTGYLYISPICKPYIWATKYGPYIWAQYMGSIYGSHIWAMEAMQDKEFAQGTYM